MAMNDKVNLKSMQCPAFGYYPHIFFLLQELRIPIVETLIQGSHPIG
jgi:hypothetical protein